MSLTQKQTADIAYQVWRAMASGEQVVLADIDVSALIQCDLGFFFGLDNATAPTGFQFIVQKSYRTAGTDNWISVDSIITGTVAATPIVTDALEAAGSTIIECGASVPAVGDEIFFKGGVITESEIRAVKARVITGVSESVTLREALTYAAAMGTYYTKAEKFARSYITMGAARMRVVLNNAYASSSPACCVRVDQLNTEGIKTVNP